MSDYFRKAINPKTGKIEDARWCDDYYGRHRYGVKFFDGFVYPEVDIKIPGENKRNKK